MEVGDYIILEMCLTEEWKHGTLHYCNHDTCFSPICFICELIKQNPLLEYNPKRFNFHIRLKDKVPFPVAANKWTPIVLTLSDMLVIWSTHQNCANITSVTNGSFLSHVMRFSSNKADEDITGQIFKWSTAFDNALFETNKINMSKRISFGDVDMNEKYYQMNKSEKGLCIIINNNTFKETWKVKLGIEKQIRKKFMTQKTMSNYEEIFSRNNFECQTYENLTKQQMLYVMSTNRMQGSYKALVIILLTSSARTFCGENFIYDRQTNDCYVPITFENLLMQFNDNNCPLFLGKPKIIIIDGPRGELVHDFRNKQTYETCKSVSQILDTQFSFLRENPDMIECDIRIPFGTFLYGNNIKIGTYYDSGFTIKTEIRNEAKFLKIVPNFELHAERTVAELQHLSEYDGNYRYLEKTKIRDMPSSSANIVSLHNATVDKYIDCGKIDSAYCFCDMCSND
ncbi:caspase-8-like protein [Leptotrombidium deliense]|uniref:Caspase-8-like protein n=1 Tax=Leptotrombidium deliense TaxID=299467 RepID=A0A443S0H4_9ACAR|nr:caspase-8-like protein [Leptotrombidium deliense]